MDKNRKDDIINRGANRRVLAALLLVSQFSLNMIVPILMCTIFGAWLGERYDMPILAVPFFVIGALAGFTNIFKMAKKILGGQDDAEKIE